MPTPSARPAPRAIADDALFGDLRGTHPGNFPQRFSHVALIHELARTSHLGT